MVKEILFVTTNKGKVMSLQNRLSKDLFTITQKELDIVEPQGISSTEVSIAKAKYAYSLVKRPLIVQDSAFHIPALNGFPGVYIKYIEESIGIEGLIKLMKNVNDRSCYFDQSITYIEGENKYKVFNSKNEKGSIALDADQTSSEIAWGAIWKLYIPQWAHKPISSLSKEEIDNYEKKNDSYSEFAQFAKWLKEGMNW